jgi:dethiobiotin synthetase
MKPLFISGIGTGIGKTVVAAILTEALKADYWKPVQAGMDGVTDSKLVASLLSNQQSRIHPETYVFQLAASPHIAARQENRRIESGRIVDDFYKMDKNRPLVIEGAGGLMVPLNENEFVIDLVKQLDARLVLVSRNYLGSINHSLMTAAICRSRGLDVTGWIFNDQYLDYENEITAWSGYPRLFSLPRMETVSRESVVQAAETLSRSRISYLYSSS